MATKNNVRQAVRNAQAKAATKTTKPAEAENPGVSPLIGSMCKIVSGRKHKGETCGVLWAATKPNRYGSMLARAYVEDEEFWIDQKHLEKAEGKVPAAVLKAYEEARKADQEEMFYIAANIGRETEKAVRIDYGGWYKDLWFPKADVEKTGKYMVSGEGDDATETPIYAIAAWRVRKDAGNDAYEALKAKQAALAKIVNA